MNAPRAIDHIVIAVDDLEKTAALYADSGFKMTPRAWHSDEMGTSNQLALFSGNSFLEVLEVDRPETLAGHDFDGTPPRFSFGAHNRAFIGRGRGMSMLCLTSADTRADVERFAAMGLTTYDPFHFERKAKLPDGEVVTVAFTLGFVTSPAMPNLAFFICQHHAPEHVWKPDYMTHDNGALDVRTVYMVADAPQDHERFLVALTGGSGEPIEGGIRVVHGRHSVEVLTPAALAEIRDIAPLEPGEHARFAGIELRGSKPAEHDFRPVEQASGLFITWHCDRA